MYHGLDTDFRPAGRPEVDAMPPAYPNRVKVFTYACALFAEEEMVERTRVMAGAAPSRMMRGGR